MAVVGGAESSGLGGERDRNRGSHFAQQRKHSLWILLAICADGDCAEVGHDAGACGGRMTVGTFTDQGTETHRRNSRHAGLGGGFERHAHFSEVKEGLKDKEVGASIFKKADLFCYMVARLAQ